MEQETTSIFDIVIWSGAAISLIGLAGLIWCIVKVARARRAGLDDDAMRDVLQGVVPINLAALFISGFGLMLVLLGIFLG